MGIHGNLIDLTGQRFERWLVQYEDGRKHRFAIWHCLCDCGTERDVFGIHLRNGSSKSCGCLMRELNSERRTSHGLSRNRTGRAYYQMVDRCCNKNSSRYKDWGGRGITVCERWLGQDGIINFTEDMGECPPGMSLDRIDNNSNYCKENCKWSTPKEQADNRRDSLINQIKEI